MIHALVTGGAGYKGTMLVKQLLELRHKVTLVDNFMYGFDSVLHLAREEHLQILPLDVRNIQTRDLKSIDIVFHLAGISGYPACEANPHSAEKINVEATRRLVNCLGACQVLVYASTTSFYGCSGSACDETSPIRPVSTYGVTKYEAEKICQERKNSISLRFATLFGVSSRMRVDLLVNDFVYKALNERSIILFDARSSRTFLHVRDAISAYIFALNNVSRMCGQVYNVGDDRLNFTKQQIAEAIREHVNFEIVNSRLPDTDVRDFKASFEKIKSLGFSAIHSLGDGIRELLKLYQFYKPHLNYRVI
jgi:nucleoside-diphosphate-sugar epimerase